MVKDAEAHAAEDKTRRELIDARNQADALAYSVEKTLNENRDDCRPPTSSRSSRAIATLREAVKGDDVAGDSHGDAESCRRRRTRWPSSSTSSQARERRTPQAGSSQHDDVKDGEVVDA